MKYLAWTFAGALYGYIAWALISYVTIALERIGQ